MSSCHDPKLDEKTALLLSVIVPAFNAERFILQALDNIHAQNIRSLEVIVVDDGSTDKTALLAESHGLRPRIIQQPNGGPGAARNSGLRAAQAPLITFLDVDDEWPAGSLLGRLVVLQSHPQIDMVMGRVRFEGLDGKELALKPWAAPNLGAGLYRKEVFAKVGNFEPSLLLDDIDWFWRTRDVQIATMKIDEITLKYRRHRDSLTASRTWLELGLGKVIHRALNRREPGRALVPVEDFIDLSGPR